MAREMGEVGDIKNKNHLFVSAPLTHIHTERHKWMIVFMGKILGSEWKNDKNNEKKLVSHDSG